MDFTALTKFLNEANKHSYANKDAKKAPSSRPGSEDYHFEKDGLAYHDTYFGSEAFIGEEIVYENNEPVWGMNYFGFIVSALANEKDVYDFLRTTLMQEYDNVIPVRGPKEYTKGEWQYVNMPKGDLEHFVGVEEIYRSNENLVYRAEYHGGLIGRPDYGSVNEPRT